MSVETSLKSDLEPSASIVDGQSSRTGTERKSWKELRNVVKNAKKLQLTLSNSVPHSFTFHRLSEVPTKFRLYFLGVPAGGRENTILYTDFDAQTIEDATEQKLTFNPLIAFQGTGTSYTKEEQLLRERKRVGAYGITAYDYDSVSRSFAFSCGSSVFTVTDSEDASAPYTPHDVTASSVGGACMDPKICPGCPNLIGFVRSGDLWVASAKPGAKHQSVKRLTYVESLEGVTAGVVSFVVQEEFDRYTGYWWRPQPRGSYGGNCTRSGSAMHLDTTDEDEDTMTSSVSTHQILYEEVDESGVEPTNIVSSTEDKDNPKGYDTYRYPRVGSVNAKSELKMLDFVYDSGAGVITEVEELKLETPLEVFYPEMEYLVRAGWTPDGKYVWAQVLNRNQTKLALILIHPQAFVRSTKSPVSPSSSSIRPNSTPQVGVDEDMLSLDEEKMPTVPTPTNRNGHVTDSDVSGVTSSSPSPVQPSLAPTVEEEDEEDPVIKSCGWGMWLVYEETNPSVWVNVNDILHFLSPDEAALEASTTSSASTSNAAPSADSSSESERFQPKDDRVSFIWASEKTGFNHLYLVTARVPQVPSMLPSGSDDIFNMASEFHPQAPPTPSPALSVPDRCPILSVVPLTEGQWEVSKKDLWIDETNRRLYFSGTKDTPMETHLYVLSLDAPVTSIKSSLTRLTDLGRSHVVTLDESCRWFVSVFSSLNEPPSCRLYGIKDASSSKELSTLMSPVLIASSVSSPLLFSYDSQRSGRRQYGLFYAPTNATPGKKCPTVLFVYGGPQVQLVTNSFKGLRFLRLQSMASLGIAVVVLDVRGSCHRGLDFEGHLKHRLGCVEIEDHIEGLHYAASQLPEGRDVIDLTRVAIHGWSYGGYLSLMGLAQRPDVFKLALAGAPVTSWEEYDTGYTERYMGVPDENPTGYKKGSVILRANDFPDEENRLLIIHGLIDENVHFRHTSLIVNSLIKACKPYQLQVYPNERHGIRQPDTSEHYETTILSFLLQHL